ncbi:hypothetical protein PMAYCL1PPCAC_15551, partial [Pristionchus mayeri]
VVIGSTFISWSIVITMIYQIICEINKGMMWASAATKRYHKSVVFSLVMQGGVPSIFYVIPMFCLFGLLVNSFIVGMEEAANNRFGTK